MQIKKKHFYLFWRHDLQFRRKIHPSHLSSGSAPNQTLHSTNKISYEISYRNIFCMHLFQTAAALDPLDIFFKFFDFLSSFKVQ